jgi:SAM-dependent methyltransferase
MLMACGVCGGLGFERFFQSREWSCSGCYLTDQAAWSAHAAVALRLDHCRDCGLIRQAPGAEVQLNYGEIARDTARQLPDYTDHIIASLAEYGVAPDDLVIEVGANDGTFLRALHAAGHRRLVGIEPSEHLAARAATAGLAIDNEFFGQACADRLLARHGAAKAVICRHTLEHVPDIRDLMHGLAAVLAPGGLCFVEVPDSDWIVSELFAHEIWDEHISYFRAGALTRLVRGAGLTPVRLHRTRFRDTCNLLCWAVRGPCPSGMVEDLAEDLTSPADLVDFQSRWDVFSARLRDAVAVAPGPVVAIGASHIQLNFLNFTGLDRSVDLLIDDDPVKAGHYAPLAKPVPIRTTSDVLASQRTGTLLRTAFPYPVWEDRICAALAPYGIASITPYDLR